MCIFCQNALRRQTAHPAAHVIVRRMWAVMCSLESVQVHVLQDGVVTVVLSHLLHQVRSVINTLNHKTYWGIRVQETTLFIILYVYLLLSFFHQQKRSCSHSNSRLMEIYADDILTCAGKAWSHFKTMRWDFSHTFPYFTDEISLNIRMWWNLDTSVITGTTSVKRQSVKMAPSSHKGQEGLLIYKNSNLLSYVNVAF